MNTRVLSAAITVLALCAAALAVEPAVTTQPTSQPKITLGYDTTRITAPLRADGTVDYLAALNQAHGQGVTPANNAAVKLVEAVGPRMFPDSTRDAALKQLGVTLPAKGEYFEDYTNPASDGPTPYDQAQKAPWQASEHPELAGWLKKNDAPLARFLEASQRPRYYMPLLPRTKADQLIVSILEQSLSPCRTMAKAMVIRANLALAEGRPADAWRDLLAVHRLGRLLGQDSALIGRLVGITTCALADTATQTMLATGTLTGEQAQQVLKDLAALGPAPIVTSSINERERYCSLDVVIFFATHLEFATRPRGPWFGRPAKDDLEKAIEKDLENEFGKEIDRMSQAILLPGVDWNQMLRSFNGYYDTLLAGMRLPTHAQRVAALKKVDAEFQEMKLRAAQPLIATSQPGQPSANTRRATDQMISQFAGSLTRSQTMADAAIARRDMTLLAAGLAVYKAQHGQYPDTLASLSPAILKTLPADLFSGKPFLYISTGQGYLLYSVGENMLDDNAAGNDIVLKTPA